MTDFKFLTPTEVIEEFPELNDKLGWTNKDIGIFYAKGLLKGRYCYRQNKAMIKVSSLRPLIVFVNDVQSQGIIK